MSSRRFLRSVLGTAIWILLTNSLVFAQSDEIATIPFETIPTGTQLQSTGGIALLGNVGIGTTSPTEALTVEGIIESRSGGVRFPDGTLQDTACNNALDYLALITKPTN